MRFAIIIAGALVLLQPGHAAASSSDAWEEFRADVASACKALVQAPEGAKIKVRVNPFGSESYGAALVVVSHDTGNERMICIFDKLTKAAELTAPFTPPAVR